MPVTISNDLPPIAFSKNLLNLILQSDDYLAAAPVNSVNFLEFTGTVANGQQFVLQWIGATATMTAADDPDDSGLQFPTGDGGNDYVEGLLDWFEGNSFIGRDYTLTTDLGGDHPRILFTANQQDSDYDFLTTNDGATGIVTNGVSDTPKDNFRHHLELWIARADGTGYNQAYSANVPLDENPLTGATTVDIHDALHSFLGSDRPVLTDPFAVYARSIRKYYLKYAQYFGAGSSATIQKVKTSDIFFVTRGGLSKPQAVARDIVAELCPVFGHPEQNRFLRQGSVNKLVTPEQPEWLSWINFTGNDQVVYPEVTIYYAEEDEPSFTFNAVNGMAVPKYGKVQIQAGYTQLGIVAKKPDKTVIYYTMRINLDGNSLTAYYGFVMDYKFREWPRYFVYENSYGAFQTIGTVGKGMAEVDRTKDDAQLQRNPYMAAIDGEFEEVNIEIQDKGTVNIGYERSGKRNTALLRDLLASSRIYVWNNGRLIPIGLNTTNLQDAEDGVNVYANTIEYYPLYQDEVWTEDPALVSDDSIPDLLSIAGSPIPPILLPDPGDGGGGDPGDTSGNDILIRSDDPHLSFDAGRVKYTAPILIGREVFVVWASQLGTFLHIPDDYTIDSVEGSLLILIPDFELQPDQFLIIQLTANPDIPIL
jgi:hypothetical protein